MKLLCGSDISDQTNDTLYQFEEGKKAHTIKFIPYQIDKHKNINSLNLYDKHRIIKIPNNHQKLISNKEFSNDINNQVFKDNNKRNDNTSELEIIEYPNAEFEKNDYNINNIFNEKLKDNINDKCQNTIKNYLRDKPDFSYLNPLSDNDYSSLNSNSDNKCNVIDDSSKSDEIICSYIEIDNTLMPKRNKKENEVIKNTSKIFSHLHKSIHSNYSFGSKYNYNSFNSRKTKKNINENSKTKTRLEKKINISKKIKKIKNHMIINKVIFKKKIIQPKKSFNINEKKEKSKNFVDSNKPNNKNDKLLSNSKCINSFRTTDYKGNSSPDKVLINEKPNVKARKSLKLFTERIKALIKVNKTININNKIYCKEKNGNIRIFKDSKEKNNNNLRRKIKSKNILTTSTNILFNSIKVKKSKNLKKSNFNTMMNLKIKGKTLNPKNLSSKGKLRKLLLNKKYKERKNNKSDISVNNITSIDNNLNLIIKRNKYKTIDKVMNKSEANKEMNNRIKTKSQNKNNIKENKEINNEINKDHLIRNFNLKIYK